jgi:GTP cyclohydrolase I
LCGKCKESYDIETKQLSDFYFVNPLIIHGVESILRGLKKVYPEFDLDSHHVTQTPTRVARMFTELCRGLGEDPKRHISTSFEESDYTGVVASTHIPFISLCAHHMAIFRGKAHVGYIPKNKVIGLSKMNRVVEILASRPQIQERLTHQIASAMWEELEPKGVITILEANHDCIIVRGAKSNSVTRTCEVFGVFAENTKNCKEEFFDLVQMGG